MGSIFSWSRIDSANEEYREGGRRGRKGERRQELSTRLDPRKRGFELTGHLADPELLTSLLVQVSVHPVLVDLPPRKLRVLVEEGDPIEDEEIVMVVVIDAELVLSSSLGRIEK